MTTATDLAPIVAAVDPRMVTSARVHRVGDRSAGGGQTVACLSGQPAALGLVGRHRTFVGQLSLGSEGGSALVITVGHVSYLDQLIAEAQQLREQWVYGAAPVTPDRTGGQ